MAQNTIKLIYNGKEFSSDYCQYSPYCTGGRVTAEIILDESALETYAHEGDVYSHVSVHRNPNAIVSFTVTAAGTTFTATNSCWTGDIDIRNGTIYQWHLNFLSPPLWGVVSPTTACVQSTGLHPSVCSANTSSSASSVTTHDTVLCSVMPGHHIVKYGAIRFNPGTWSLISQNPSLSGELLDPVPKLMTGGAITANTLDPRLVTHGRDPVRGVAADGVAQLVLRIKGAAHGDRLRIRLPAAQSATADLEGGLRSIEAITETREITVAVQGTSPPMAFAVYRAPMDFSDGTLFRDMAERNISIQIEREGGGSPVQVPVKIVRPPVVLVHGLWDGPATWVNFTPLTSDTAFTQFRFDYKNTNGEAFLVNAEKLADKLFSWRAQFAMDKEVAVGQFDFVAHSMGGNIVRTLDRTGLNRTPWNFRRGYVHKVITIGTPHRGSPFAREIIRSENLCVAAALEQIGSLPSTGFGALQDLAGDGSSTCSSASCMSAALQVQQNIPMSLFAGRLRGSQVVGLLPGLREDAQKVCRYFYGQPNRIPLMDQLSPDNYRSWLGGAHDGIVPLVSALDGRTASATNTWGDGLMQDGGVHSAGTKSLGVRGPVLLRGNSVLAEAVRRVLSAPLSSEAFRK